MSTSVALRLIHNGAQPGTPLDELLDFGLQDVKGVVHPGVPTGDGQLRFHLVLEAIGEPGDAPPRFKGSFVQGKPGGLFLYLSWKRRGIHEHPWGWRIKVPLAGIGWAEIEAASVKGRCIAADVTSRRPHKTEPVRWAVTG